MEAIQVGEGTETTIKQESVRAYSMYHCSTLLLAKAN